MKTKSIMAVLSVFVALAFSFNGTAMADESQLLAMIRNLEKQMNQMQGTIDWQKEKIQMLENKAPSVNVAPASGSDFGENYFDNNLKAAIGDSAKWLKGLKFSGDFRLRYEAKNEQHKSSSNDQNRFRFRLRFGFEKKFSDELKVGFRLASGDLGGITSTNQSFDSNFGFKSVVIDKAYATYTPNWAKVGPIKELEITGGKFSNPFADGSAPLMIWDSDVTPEGVYEKIDIKGLRSDNLNVDFSLLAGQMILEEGSGSEHDDAELFAYQVGIQSKIKGVTAKPIELNTFASWYDYSDFSLAGNFSSASGNYTGVPPVPTTQLASAFKVFESYTEMGLNLGDLPKLKFHFSWAHNFEHSPLDVAGIDENGAWSSGVTLGKAKKKGTWELSYQYLWVEANAVPGVFMDSDFGHADRRGSVIRAAYALTDNLQLNAAMFYTNRISTTPSRPSEERQLYQVDLVWKF